RWALPSAGARRRGALPPASLWPGGQRRAAPSRGRGLAAAPRPPWRHHDGRPAAGVSGSLRLPRVWLGFTGLFLQVTLRSMQWRGSGGPGLAAVILTLVPAWS